MFAHIDPNLPALVTQAGITERTQEYRYALAALICGLSAFMTLIAGFVYLVMHGHPAPAGLFLGTGLLGLTTGFVRARLRSGSN